MSLAESILTMLNPAPVKGGGKGAPQGAGQGGLVEGGDALASFSALMAGQFAAGQPNLTGEAVAVAGELAAPVGDDREAKADADPDAAADNGDAARASTLTMSLVNLIVPPPPKQGDALPAAVEGAPQGAEPALVEGAPQAPAAHHIIKSGASAAGDAPAVGRPAWSAAARKLAGDPAIDPAPPHAEAHGAAANAQGLGPLRTEAQVAPPPPPAPATPAAQASQPLPAEVAAPAPPSQPAPEAQAADLAVAQLDDEGRAPSQPKPEPASLRGLVRARAAVVANETAAARSAVVDGPPASAPRTDRPADALKVVAEPPPAPPVQSASGPAPAVQVAVAAQQRPPEAGEPPRASTRARTSAAPGSAAAASIAAPAPDPVFKPAAPASMQAASAQQGFDVAEAAVEGGEAKVKDMALDAASSEEPSTAGAALASTAERHGQPAPAAAQITSATAPGLAAAIAKRLEAKTSRFEIELDPAGLGKVKVQVHIDADGRLAAQLNFERPDTAAALKGRADELRTALQSAGFDLGGAGLSFTSGGDQGGGQPFSFADNNNSQRAAQAFARAVGNADEADRPPPPPVTRRASSSALDLRI